MYSTVLHSLYIDNDQTQKYKDSSESPYCLLCAIFQNIYLHVYNHTVILVLVAPCMVFEFKLFHVMYHHKTMP